MPALLLIVAFIAVELWSIIALGGAIGTLPVLALLALGLFGGVALIRRAGEGAMLRTAQAMRQEGDPAAALRGGAAGLMAGVLLMIPGFVSDALALCMLIPAVRSGVFGAASRGLRGQTPMDGPHRPGRGPGPGRTTGRGPGAPIEAEYREIDPTAPPEQ